jgi:hypothetical protein
LILREEHGLRVFGNNRAEENIWTDGDEVTGGWRGLYNEELRDLYSSPSIIRIINSVRMKWAGYAALMVKRGCI